MIPDIGVMIAAYIFTRMAALLGQPSPNANVLAKVFAVITMIVATLIAFDLIARGTSVNLPSLQSMN
jgi:hypothetical protein